MLSLDLGFANFTKVMVDEKLLKKVAEKTLAELSKNGKYEASLTFIGDAKIKKLNREFRKKDKVTDVLSFSFISEESPKKIKGESMHLGEIFISVPQAKRQAKEKDVSLTREFALLVAHGIIHLCGFDHERSEKESLETDRIQEKVLAEIF